MILYFAQVRAIYSDHLPTMPSYKLYYFPVKGVAEPIRLLFAYKGIQYEDIRIPGDKWPETKPDMPFGVMPVLEEDGKKLGGSIIILRYLAEKPEFNVAGSNAWENAWLANIGDFIKDFFIERVKVIYEKDEKRKEELEKRFGEEVIPKYLGKLNEMTNENGYLCCGKLTWVDLLLYQQLESLVEKKPEILKDFPGLAKAKANVEGNANITKWLAERPQT